MKMICDYSDEYIINLIKVQLNLFKVTNSEMNQIGNILSEVKERAAFSFSHSRNKYYRKNGEVYFNPFHAAQYTIFLYFLSNTMFRDNKENRVVCDKIYYLNRMLNGCDLFYEVNLPDIFFLEHPLGSVIGRGQFDNYFSFSQGCTVGNNKGIFPVFDEKVKMMSNSKVLGACSIGSNVIIAANTYIKDTNIPNNTIVFGISPDLILKKNELT